MTQPKQNVTDLMASKRPRPALSLSHYMPIHIKLHYMSNHHSSPNVPSWRALSRPKQTSISFLEAKSLIVSGPAGRRGAWNARPWWAPDGAWECAFQPHIPQLRLSRSHWARNRQFQARGSYDRSHFASQARSTRQKSQQMHCFTPLTRKMYKSCSSWEPLECGFTFLRQIPLAHSWSKIHLIYNHENISTNCDIIMKLMILVICLSPGGHNSHVTMCKIHVILQRRHDIWNDVRRPQLSSLFFMCIILISSWISWLLTWTQALSAPKLFN